MKYFYCLLLVLSCSTLKAQTTLINSGNDIPSRVNDAPKIDSLKIQSKDQASYRQVQQSAVKPVDMTGVKEDKFSQKLQDISRNNNEIIKLRVMSEANKRELDSLRKEIGKEKKTSSGLKNKNAKMDSALIKENRDLVYNLNSLNKINITNNGYYEVIMGKRGDVSKMIKSLQGIRDSIINTKTLSGNSRIQITSSQFKISSISSLYDTSFTRKTKEKIIDSLALMSSTFKKLDDQARDLIDDAKISINNLDKAVETATMKDSMLAECYNRVKILMNKKDTIDNNFLKIVEDESKEIQKFLTSFSIGAENKILVKSRLDDKDYAKRFVAIKSEFDKTVVKYKAFYDENLSAKSEEIQESEFGALPNVTSLIGEQRALNLNISVLGSYSKKSKKDFDVVEAKLFTGNVPSSLASARSLFIPEISTFGTQIKYVKGGNIIIKTSSDTTVRQFVSTFSANFELNLLSKKLSNGVTSTTIAGPNTSTLVNSGLNNFVIHARGGGEVVLLKEVVSLYANMNWISIIDNLQNFHQEFNGLSEIDKKSSWVFFDVGCRVLLNPAGAEAKRYTNSGFNIVADFNLIIPKMWGRQLMNGSSDVSQTDMFIPIVRLGIRKSLSMFSKK